MDQTLAQHLEAARLPKRAQERAWYAKNKDRVTAKRRAERQKDGEKVRARDRAHYAKNK